MKRPTDTNTDGVSPLERALLDAGKSYRTSPETRAKTLAALGLAGSAAVAGTAGAVSLSSLAKATAKLTWGKLLVGAAVVGGVAAVPGGYYLWHHKNAAAVAAHPATVVSVGGDSPAASLAPSGPSGVAEGAAAPSGRSARGPARALPLAEELAMLDGARAALGSADPRRALALLDAYDDAHPHGRRELEAEVLRIDALARSGHADAARKRAETFLRRHPQSVLAARARGYLGR